MGGRRPAHPALRISSRWDDPGAADAVSGDACAAYGPGSFSREHVSKGEPPTMPRKLIAFTPPEEQEPAGVAEMVYLNALLRLPDACRETGCSMKTLQRAYVHGRLKILPFGARGIRIRRRDLIAWV